jgi:hypothetical protein
MVIQRRPVGGNSSDDDASAAYVASALDIAGHHATAASVRNCGTLHSCRCRLCPRCQLWAWINRNVRRLLKLAPPVDARTRCVTLKTHGATKAQALKHALMVWARFVRKTRYALLGALHVEPGEHGWLANFHVVIWSAESATIRRDWRSAGANRGAHVEPLKDLESAIRYAVSGAVDTSKIPAPHLPSWMRAIHRKHLVRKAHVGTGVPLQRENATVPPLENDHRNSVPPDHKPVCGNSPSSRDVPERENIAKRILRQVRSECSTSDLRRDHFASFERSTFDDVICELVNQGAVRRIKTPHGHRLRVPFILPDDLD